MGMRRTSETESVQAFWDAALKRLKAYVEDEVKIQGLASDDRLTDKVLNQHNRHPDGPNQR